MSKKTKKKYIYLNMQNFPCTIYWRCRESLHVCVMCMRHVIAVAVSLPSFSEDFPVLYTSRHVFYVFLRFFENPKKRDFLRFFCFASHFFSNYEGDKASHGKGQNSTPRHTKTPKPIFTKIDRRDYVLESPGMQNFVAIDSGVSVPQIRGFAVLLGWL